MESYPDILASERDFAIDKEKMKNWRNLFPMPVMLKVRPISLRITFVIGVPGRSTKTRITKKISLKKFISLSAIELESYH